MKRSQKRSQKRTARRPADQSEYVAPYSLGDGTVPGFTKSGPEQMSQVHAIVEAQRRPPGQEQEACAALAHLCFDLGAAQRLAVRLIGLLQSGQSFPPHTVTEHWYVEALRGEKEDAEVAKSGRMVSAHTIDFPFNCPELQVRFYTAASGNVEFLSLNLPEVAAAAAARGIGHDELLRLLQNSLHDTALAQGMVRYRPDGHLELVDPKSLAEQRGQIRVTSDPNDPIG
jgi:hypothetical protein